MTLIRITLFRIALIRVALIIMTHTQVEWHITKWQVDWHDSLKQIKLSRITSCRMLLSKMTLGQIRLNWRIFFRMTLIIIRHISETYKKNIIYENDSQLSRMTTIKMTSSKMAIRSLKLSRIIVSNIILGRIILSVENIYRM